MFPGTMLAAALAWSIGAIQAPDVQWDAPPGCPDAAAVGAEISRRLGRPLAPEEARVQGRVRREGRGFVLRLELTAGQRREARELRDPSCGALADAAALLVVAAVAPQGPIVPDAPGEPVEPGPGEPVAEPGPGEASASEPVAAEPVANEPVAAEPVAPIAEPPAAVEPEPDRKRMSRRIGGFVRLHGGGAVGQVPGVTGAVGLAGGLLWRRVRLELHAAAIVPRTGTTTVEGTPVDVRVGLYVAGVTACGRLGRGVVEVPLCAGVEAGAARGVATKGLLGGRPATVPWFAVALGPALAWHAGRRWSLWAAVQVVLAPVRPRFEAGEGMGADELFKPPVASGRLLAGVEFRFGDPW
jgi:hypothetical protein